MRIASTKKRIYDYILYNNMFTITKMGFHVKPQQADASGTHFERPLHLWPANCVTWKLLEAMLATKHHEEAQEHVGEKKRCREKLPTSVQTESGHRGQTANMYRTADTEAIHKQTLEEPNTRVYVNQWKKRYSPHLQTARWRSYLILKPIASISFHEN